MDNQNASQGRNNRSIALHPLFPAIVALWFAALFGLGSMAVRASLIESMIVASRIDLLVPTVAPPLGMTGRIIVAAIMAIVGGLIGVTVGRRLARPKPVSRERRRGAAPLESSRSPSPYAAPEPIFTGESAQDGQFAAPGRRRALAVIDEPSREFAVHEAAPLPGGQPQILDVTRFDFDGPGRPEAEPAPASADASALELEEFAAIDTWPAHADEVAIATADDADAAPQPQPPHQEQAPAYRDLDDPVQPAQAFDSSQISTVEVPAFTVPSFIVPPAETAAPEPAPQEAPVAVVRAFDAPRADAVAPQPVQPGMPVTVPASLGYGQEFAATAPVDSLAFPSPAVAPPVECEAADEEDLVAALRNPRQPMPDFAAQPEFEPQPEIAPEASDAPAADCAPEHVAAPQHFAPPLSAAAERLVNADLAELSPVELIERLALSLQRRRQVAPGAPLAGFRQVLSPEAAPASAPWTPYAVRPEPEPMPVPEPNGPAAGMSTEEIVAELPRFSLPAALRPIDFSQYEHEDDQPLSVPARSIAMSPPSEADAMPDYAAQPEQAAQSQAEFEPEPEPEVPVELLEPAAPASSDETADEVDDDVLAAGYSSLLDLSRPADQRQHPFVRIEDPDAETEVSEPIVIFPGQGMRAGTRFAAAAQGPVVAPAASAPSLAEVSPQPRRFDAPVQAAETRDPGETERALRSALATLQRMSGAA